VPLAPNLKKNKYNTCTYSLLKNIQKTRGMREKNSKKKKVKNRNVCINSSPQVVQVFVAQTKNLVHTLASTSFPKFVSLQFNLELVP
jgi:hypothetical protein